MEYLLILLLIVVLVIYLYRRNKQLREKPRSRWDDFTRRRTGDNSSSGRRFKRK